MARKRSRSRAGLDQNSRNSRQQPLLVLAAAGALATLLVVGIWSSADGIEAYFVLAQRWSLRVAALWFACTFASAGLQRWSAGPGCGWLAANQPWLELGFAVLLVTHLGLVVGLHQYLGFWPEPWLLLVAGLTCVVVLALAVSRLLGRSRLPLYRAGMFWLCLVLVLAVAQGSGHPAIKAAVLLALGVALLLNLLVLPGRGKKGAG